MLMNVVYDAVGGFGVGLVEYHVDPSQLLHSPEVVLMAILLKDSRCQRLAVGMAVNCIYLRF